jgi:hypothetical protein
MLRKHLLRAGIEPAPKLGKPQHGRIEQFPEDGDLPSAMQKIKRSSGGAAAAGIVDGSHIETNLPFRSYYSCALV